MEIADKFPDFWQNPSHLKKEKKKKVIIIYIKADQTIIMVDWTWKTKFLPPTFRDVDPCKLGHISRSNQLESNSFNRKCYARIHLFKISYECC